MLHAANFPAVWTLIDGGEVGVSVFSRVCCDQCDGMDGWMDDGVE